VWHLVARDVFAALRRVREAGVEDEFIQSTLGCPSPVAVNDRAREVDLRTAAARSPSVSALGKGRAGSGGRFLAYTCRKQLADSLNTREGVWSCQGTEPLTTLLRCCVSEWLIRWTSCWTVQDE